MKRIFSLLLIVMSFSLVNSVSAQVRKIPASVTDSFKAKYPNASKVEWKDKLTGFVAEYDNGSGHYASRFTNKGAWEYTEQALHEADLPAVVKDGHTKSKYAEWSIESVTKIDLPGDKVQYRVQVKKSDIQKKNLLFSSEGRLLKDNITL